MLNLKYMENLNFIWVSSSLEFEYFHNISDYFRANFDTEKTFKEVDYIENGKNLKKELGYLAISQTIYFEI